MRSLLPLLFCVATVAAQAQQVQWLTTGAIDYNINPDVGNHLICASDGDHVYVARSTSLAYLYNEIFGEAVIERHNAQGDILWSFQLGDSVLLESMASDVNGRLVLGGRFFRNVHLNGEVDLAALNGNEFPETFLIALDADGDLLWQRNIAPPPFDEADVQSITFDPQGRAWYATCNFFHADIKRLDDAGNDVETRPIEDAKTIGSLSFDPSGALYVSGSASTPGLTVNGTFYALTPQYNFFVARMGVDGSAQWLRSAEDVTFQRPRVVADDLGHAYLIGSPFDSLSWGGIHFHGPEWNSTFFLTRLDSTGDFQWGYQPPLGAPFSGQFTIGHGETMGVDAQGNVAIQGIAQGLIQWGNNVVSDVGTIQDRAFTVLRLDSTGTPLWELYGGSDDYDVPEEISVMPDGTCHVAVFARDTFQLGTFTADLSSPALVVARISPDLVSGVAELPSPTDQLLAWPSPFDHSFQLSGAFDAGRPVALRIRDASGRVVERDNALTGLGEGLTAGCYFVEVSQSGRTWHTRVVKQ